MKERIKMAKVIRSRGFVIPVAALVLAVLLVAALGAGTALAHRGGGFGTSPVTSGAELAEAYAPRLERAVESGTITQMQADGITAWLTGAPDAKFQLRTRINELDDDARDELRDTVKSGVVNLEFNLEAAVATILGISESDLEDAISENNGYRGFWFSRSLRSGSSSLWSGVAETLGLSAETVQNAFTQAKADHRAAVEAIKYAALEATGVLTAAEANAIQTWEEAKPSLLSDGTLFRPGNKFKEHRGFGRGHHRGDRGGDRDSGITNTALNVARY